jgi:hypothetical protein
VPRAHGSSWLGGLGVVAAVAASVGAPAGAPVTVPMAQYDYGRTGANLQEWMLNPSNVDATHFGKLFSPIGAPFDIAVDSLAPGATLSL